MDKYKIVRKAATVALWVPAIALLIAEAGMIAINAGLIVAVIAVIKKFYDSVPVLVREIREGEFFKAKINRML